MAGITLIVEDTKEKVKNRPRYLSRCWLGAWCTFRYKHRYDSRGTAGKQESLLIISLIYSGSARAKGTVSLLGVAPTMFHRSRLVLGRRCYLLDTCTYVCQSRKDGFQGNDLYSRSSVGTIEGKCLNRESE